MRRSSSISRRFPFAAPDKTRTSPGHCAILAALCAKLEKRGVHAGLPLSRWYPERSHELLVAVTEMNTKEQIDLLVRSLAEDSK